MTVLTIFCAALVVLFLLAIYKAPIWLWAIYFILWSIYLHGSVIGMILSIVALILVIFSISPIRRAIIVRPIFKFTRKQKSHISDMEKQALSAGNAGIEKGLFSGRPDWITLKALAPLNLRKDELAVINGPVEELCKLIDDWDIRYNKRAIPEALWDFVIKNKLFGLRVPKERGGFSLSFQAQSLILGKVASRSIDVATMIELPTSLWPDEIVEKYGTTEQKEFYMPRFAENKEIVSFAITGISNGSDATSMRDVGKVEYGMHKGKKVLGIRLNWQKRYITFAPKASLLVLGFRLYDPENLIGSKEDIGITLALIPSNHPGIKIGRRHLPTNVAFPNGPIWGENVFIPLDWVIGGKQGAGRGWKMIMECLFVGRAVALPAISIAAVKIALRYSAAYARIRRQFGSYIGKFEGIEEPLTRLTEMAYVTESARSITTAMVDAGYRPLAVSSFMKYRTTEYARQAINDAMDIHAGRGVMDGPSNYLMSAFLAGPIGVSVEGANIVTRSIISFAQGALQAHPYFYKELESCEIADEKEGLRKFEEAFLSHTSFLISNLFRTITHNITGAAFGGSPKDTPSNLKYWYKKIWQASCRFSFIADVSILMMGPSLKKRQKLGGRLADALSELFMLLSVLKRYEDDGSPDTDYPIVELCMRNGLFRFQTALSGAISNFPIKIVRPFFSVVLYPFGKHAIAASDELGHSVTQLVLQPGPILDRLTRYVFISNDPDDITGRLEIAFKKAVENEAAQKKVDSAIRSGKTRRVLGVDWIQEAEELGAVTKDEADRVRELEALAEKASAVDHFDPSEISSK